MMAARENRFFQLPALYLSQEIGLVFYRIRTVSYTHLTHHREYTTVPDPYYGDYSDFELVITPVSYTHLDVYKRQVLIL